MTTVINTGIVTEVLEELKSAASRFPEFASPHEGIAIIHEEFLELQAEVYKNPSKHADRAALMRKEAIQLTAMSLRFLIDLCERSNISATEVLMRHTDMPLLKDGPILTGMLERAVAAVEKDYPAAEPGYYKRHTPDQSSPEL